MLLFVTTRFEKPSKLYIVTRFIVAEYMHAGPVGAISSDPIEKGCLASFHVQVHRDLHGHHHCVEVATLACLQTLLTYLLLITGQVVGLLDLV